MTFIFPSNHASSAAMPIACRKRKELDEGEFEQSMDRSTSSKGARRWANLPQGSQESQFHPLPAELNLQMLADLGYNVASQGEAFEEQRMGINHSPSSSGSDLCTSDVATGSAESYFVKGIRAKAGPTPAYPNFNIYPEHIYPRPPGLLGMHMQRNASQSIDSTGDGMDVDWESQQQDQGGPSHG